MTDYNAMADEDFRREIRTFVEREYPQQLRFILQRARWHEMKDWWRTLYERLTALPGDLVLYPGHDYGSAPSAPLSEVRRTNAMLRAPSYDDFLRIRGG